MILIVGGGIVGLSTAWFLRERGADVVVLEANDALAGSASCGNAGLIALGHAPMPQPKLTGRTLKMLLDPLGPLYVKPRFDLELLRWFVAFRRACGMAHFERSMRVLAEMGRLARGAFEEIVRDGPVACELGGDGWLEAYRTEAGRKRVLETVALERDQGFDIAILEDGALQARYPVFRPEVLGGALRTESRTAWPDAFIEGLADALRARGVEIRLGARVARLDVAGGRCRGAVLADGTAVEAARTVLAAGVWSDALARAAGVRVPMQAGKGYHVSVPNPGLPVGSVMCETYVAVTPMGGRLRLAGTVELSGVNLDMRRERLEMLPKGAALYLRDLDPTDRRDEWCGLRPCTADGLPALGFAPRVRDLLVGTGHAMMGFALGPCSGRLLAQLALDERPDMDVAPFDPARF